MIHDIVNLLAIFPPDIAILIVSATPVLEQRVAFPLALLVYHLPPLKAYLLIMVGNIVPVLFLSFFADRFHRWVQNNSGTFSGKVWVKKLHEAQEAFGKYEKYGMFGLMLFIALPLPGSGVFTGAIIAFLMGVPFRHSWPYLVGSVLLSGLMSLVIFYGLDRMFF